MRTLILGLFLKSSIVALAAWVTPSNAGVWPRRKQVLPSVEREGHVHRMPESSTSDIPATLLMPGPCLHFSFRSRKWILWVMAPSWILTPLLLHLCIKSSSCKLWLTTASVCPAGMRLVGPPGALGSWPAQPKKVIPGVQHITSNVMWLSPSHWPDIDFKFCFLGSLSLEENFMEVASENEKETYKLTYM